MSVSFWEKDEGLLKSNLLLLNREKQMIRKEISVLLQDHFDQLPYMSLSLSEAAALAIGECFRILGCADESEIDADMKLWLCNYLAQKYSVADLLRAAEKEVNYAKEPKIAFWASNQYAEKALTKFGELFPSSETVLVDSFSQVCEFISGADHFGVLPIENSSDGRLAGFYRLIDKYELKICAVCDIEDDAGEAFTRFALVAGDFYPFSLSNSVHIELSLISSDRSYFMEVIRIAQGLGMTASRMFSVPLYYNREDAGNDTVTLTVNDQSILPFLIYLYLFGKDINVLGFYIQF